MLTKSQKFDTIIHLRRKLSSIDSCGDIRTDYGPVSKCLPRRTLLPRRPPPSPVRTFIRLSKGYSYTNWGLSVTIINPNGQRMEIPAAFGSRRDRSAAIQTAFRPRGGDRGRGRGRGTSGPRAKNDNGKRVSILYFNVLHFPRPASV